MKRENWRTVGSKRRNVIETAVVCVKAFLSILCNISVHSTLPQIIVKLYISRSVEQTTWFCCSLFRSCQFVLTHSSVYLSAL